MNIGFLGLGKLGLPVSLAVEDKGHNIFGHDISTQTLEDIKNKHIRYKEEWVEKFLPNTKLEINNIDDLVKNSEIIFVPIQTPHDPKYEGITRIPSERIDFDYSYLKSGIKDLSEAIEKNGEDKVVIIISTVLPGTIRTEIKPLLGKHTKLCYNPFFIAMGSTIRDFLHPEFILFGVDDEEAAKKAQNFYKTICNSPFYKTTIENAELIKVSYNTMISTKISFVNTIMEACHHLPNTNIDDVTNGLKLATRRLISGAYMSGGMGDGGGCHPRDNIALSHLSQKLGLSYDWFDSIMAQREKQTEWLADMVIDNSNNRQINILGKTFKPETNLTLGSPSLLLENLIKEKGHKVFSWDPYIDDKYEEVNEKYNWLNDNILHVFFIGTKHPDFINFKFPKDSIVIDPFRYIYKANGSKIIRIGDNTNK
ncbi:nucleotide sugar dehydrogenase [Candidatus Pelagibacter ubique]|nr:nucleotide sugar dehydrogenase [Candidatus Pelagibacter ubique]